MMEKVHIADYRRILRRRWGIILAMTGLVTTVVTVITLKQPVVYQARAKMLVEKDRPEISVFPQYESISTFDPVRHIRTQAEMISSDPILEKVMSKLHLAEKWYPNSPDRDYRALKNLDNHLKVEHIPPANILVISYEDSDPVLAAEIVNSIASVFVEQREQVRGQNLGGAIGILRVQLEANREILKKSESDLDAFKREKELIFIGDRVIDEQNLAEFNRAYISAKTERLAQKGQLESLKKLPSEERIAALAVMEDNLHFQNLRNKLDDDKAELAELQEKYQPKHPAILEIKARINQTQDSLQKLAQGIVQGLEVEYQKKLKEEEGLQEALGLIKLEDFLQGENRLEYIHLKSQVETNRAVLLALQARIEEETATQSLPEIGLEIIEPALVPKFPIKPNKKMNISLGVLMGLVSGIVIAFFFDYLNQGLDSISEVKRVLNLPILSVIAKDTPLLVEGEQDAAHLDPYRMLRAYVHFCNPKKKYTTFLVTSTGKGEGKSFTLVNLAICMAKMGDKVLIVDPDFRRPGIHKLLKLPNETGLVDLLAQRLSLGEVLHRNARNIENLDVITTGSDYEKGVILLNSETIRKFLKDVEGGYDIILFDSPRILGISDTFYLAEAAEGVLLVVEPNHYPRTMVLQAKQQLETTGAKILGVVINKVDFTGGEMYYRYYQYEKDEEPGFRPRAEKPA